MKLLCLIGIHRWVFVRKGWDYIYSPFVAMGMPAVFDVNVCERCGKKKAKLSGDE